MENSSKSVTTPVVETHPVIMSHEALLQSERGENGFFFRCVEGKEIRLT